MPEDGTFALPWTDPPKGGLSGDSRDQVARSLFNQLMASVHHIREHASDAKPIGTVFATHGSTVVFAVLDGECVRVLDCTINREVIVDV